MKCLNCGKDIIRTNPKANNVKYCSMKCRNKVYYKKNGGAEAQRKYMQARILNKYSKDQLKQCKVCGKWFRQVGSHVVLIHGYETAREYREEYGFDVKKGQLPEDYRKIKAEHVFKNKTVENLKNGKKFWFSKGDKQVGRYKRSDETMERLRVLHKLNKKI